MTDWHERAPRPGRRELLAAAALLGPATLLHSAAAATQPASGATSTTPTFCAFEKFLHEFSHDDLADALAELGFDGVEATARRNGRISPDQAEEELPALVEALAKRDLEVTILTTEINRADDPENVKLLSTAAKLGIKRYRLGWFKYDDNRPITRQLKEYRQQLLELAALNRELGITGLWQNHCGPEYVGATIWDLHQLIADVPTSEVAVAFDIRHATVEAGRSWTRLYQLIKPQIGALYMKDFVWSARRDKHVPLGEGRVDPVYFEMLKQSPLNVPISVHVEYLPQRSSQENVAAIARDFTRLKSLMETAEG